MNGLNRKYGASVPDDYELPDSLPRHIAIERFNHVDSLVNGLMANRAKLVEVGILGEDVSDEDLAKMVCAIVDNAFECRNEIDAGVDYDSEVFERMAGFSQVFLGEDIDVRRLAARIAADYRKLFNYAGISFPTLADDWRVDRRHTAATRLGYEVDPKDFDGGENAFIEVEDDLCRRYGDGYERFINFGYGVGENLLKARKRMLRLGTRGGRRHVDIGVGNRLFYRLDTILNRYLLRPEEGAPGHLVVYGNFFSRILAKILRRHLKSLRDADSEVKGKWFEGNDFYDLNEIYRALNTPEAMREHVGFSSKDIGIALSAEFASARRSGEMEVAYVGLVRFFKDFGLEDPDKWVNRMRGSLLKISNFASKTLKSLRYQRERGVDYDLAQITEKYCAFEWLCPEVEFPEIDWTTIGDEDMPALLEVMIEKYEGFHEQVSGALANDDLTREDIMELFSFDPDADASEVLRMVYNPEFVASIKVFTELEEVNYFANNNRSEGDDDNVERFIDLNQLELEGERYISANYPVGYLKGDFMQVPDILKDPRNGEPLQINTAEDVRAMSQGEDAEYKKHVEAALQVMAPGAVISSDGIIHSLTRKIRIDGVAALMEKYKGEYKAWIVFSGNRPVQITIQRASEEGFLTERDFKRRHPGHSVLSIEAARYVPYITVSNEVRRLLVDMGEHTYRGRQDEIDRLISQAYVDVIVEGQVTEEKIKNSKVIDELNMVFFLHYMGQYLIHKMDTGLYEMIFPMLLARFHEEAFGEFSKVDYRSRVASGSYSSGDEVDNRDPAVLLTSIADKVYRKVCSGGMPNLDFIQGDVRAFFERVYEKAPKTKKGVLIPSFALLDIFIAELKEHGEQLFAGLLGPDVLTHGLLAELESFARTTEARDRLRPGYLSLLIDKLHYARAQALEINLAAATPGVGGTDVLESVFLTSVLDEAYGAFSQDEDDDGSGRLSTITPMQVHEAVSRVMHALGYNDRTKPEYVFDPTKLCVFPRDGASTGVNQFYSIDKTDIPDNRDVRPVSDLERMQLRRALDEISERTGLERPIFFLNFTDCVTNRSFLDRFKEWGIEKYVEVYDVDLTQIDFRDPSKAWEVFEAIQPYVGRFEYEGDDIKKLRGIDGGAGGIMIAGGNWDNTPSEGGKIFKKYFFYPILDSMTRFNPNSRALRSLFICFAAQEHHDVLVSRYYKDVTGFDHNDLVVQQGMMEFGMSPFVKTGQPFDAHIFKGIPSGRASLVATHGGQIPKMPEVKPGLITPIGMNQMTYLAMGYATLDGRSISYPVHPEVAPEHIDRVLLEAGTFKSSISRALGGVPFACIESGFDVRIKGDAGGRVAFNTIKLHADSMVDQLRNSGL